MRNTLLLVLIFSQIGLSDGKRAWWLRVQYVPKDTFVEDICISKIDTSLKFISILDDSLIPIEMKSEKDFIKPSENGCCYRWTGDINKDCKNETAVVGVYEDNNNKKGRILLIYSGEIKENKKILLVHKEEGDAGFHILSLRHKNRLYITTCMECGQSCYITFKKKKYKLFCEDNGL